MNRARQELGHAEVSRRCEAAEKYAKQAGEDTTCFHEMQDREEVEDFCKNRFVQLALSMSQEGFDKIEKQDNPHELYFLVMCKRMEKGKMI